MTLTRHIEVMVLGASLAVVDIYLGHAATIQVGICALIGWWARQMLHGLVDLRAQVLALRAEIQAKPWNGTIQTSNVTLVAQDVVHNAYYSP